MHLRTEDAVRKEMRVVGGKSRTGWVFLCTACGDEMWVMSWYLKDDRTGLCKSCSSARHCRNMKDIHKKRPFESLYNSGLMRRACKDGIAISLTYEDFIEFTKITDCHYCGCHVEWISHGRQSPNQGYHLDRKNSDLGYHKDNLVVACKVCNRIKNNHLTYEEMRQLAPHLRAIRCNREGQKWQ